MGSRWRDGRSVLLVSAGGSDARTEASGMMAGLPCPGAATKAAGGSARAKISPWRCFECQVKTSRALLD